LPPPSSTPAATLDLLLGHADSGPPTFPDLLTAAGYAQAADKMRRATDECAAALGSKAALFNTTATAVDIDQIRSALGQPTPDR
jgi:hypothetical protein